MPHALIAATIALAVLPSACSAEVPDSPSGPKFPALTGRVVDEADLIPPQQERSLAAASEALERQAGPQFVIVTVKTLQGYAIEEYGVRLGRHWGVGHKDRNDGLLLIVAPNERKVRIEAGTGLEERVSDPFAKQVIETRILPEFREDRYPEGIEAGSEALIERLRSGNIDRNAGEKEAA